MLNLKIKQELSSVTTTRLMSFKNLHNERTPVAVKAEFNQVEENSCVDDIEDNEMISRETVHRLDLGIKHDISVGITHPMSSNNKSTPVTVKEELIQIKESSVDDIEDETITKPAVQMLDLRIKQEISSVTTTQHISFNDHLHNESTSVAVKEEFKENVDENEEISRETVHTLDLGIKHDISGGTTQPMSSNNKSTPVAVKEELIQIKKKSLDDMEDETISQPAGQMLNLKIKQELSSVTTTQHMPFNDHLHNEIPLVAVKEEFNQVEEHSCKDDIEDNEMISRETVHTPDLGIKHEIVITIQPMSSNNESIVTVKKELIEEEESSVDDIEDETISRETVHTQDLGIKHEISGGTTQSMPSNNKSKPVAVKEDFIQIKKSSVNDIENETVINTESYQVNNNTKKDSKSCYCCDICYKILNKKGFQKHMRIHSKIKPYACSQCNNSFYQRCHLEEHMRSHTGEKPYSCSQCDKTFSRRTTLKTHMRVHTGEKPYACSQCDQTFSQNGTLNSHMRIHTGVKPYACSQCDKSFTSNIVLITHMRIHTGEKPYACSHCDKAFSQSVNLQRHLRIHSEEKPYTCSQCNKSFSGSGMLKIHMRIHTGEKPYACSQCNKAFTQKVNLQRHGIIHSEKEPYVCSQCNKSFSSSRGLKKHIHLCKVIL